MSFNFATTATASGAPPVPSTQYFSPSGGPPPTGSAPPTGFAHYQPPYPTLHANPAASEPPIDPVLMAEEVSARFIDALANQFGFGDHEQDLRQNLHGFAKMGRGLTKADIATRAYIVSAIFSLIKENRAMAAAHQSTQTIMADLQIRLDATFSLSTEQKTNIRIIGNDMIFECNCITFMHMHFDVETKLREDQKNLKLTNIYGSPSREKALMAHVKRQCSSIRNAFRESIRDSVIGEDTCTLTDFVYESSSKFKRTGGNSDLGPAFTSRLAILRRFSYENPELLDRVEDSDEPLSPPSPSEETSSRSSTPSSGEPPRKKRKSGRTAKGEDYWSQVEKWFEARQKQWGDSWGTPGWKAYILETAHKDELRYQPQVVQNPFMVDVEVGEGFQAAAIGGAVPMQGQLGGMDAILSIM